MAPGLTAYLMTCVPTSEVYVGITRQDLRKRFNQHMSSAKSAGHKMRARRTLFDRDDFTIEAVACAKSYSDLLAVEQLLIRQYDSTNSGLNCSSGGRGNPGFSHDHPCRKQMSDKRRALWADPSYRLKISRAQKAAWKRKSSQERAARSQAAVGQIALNRRPKAPATHCIREHLFDAANTIVGKDGRRRCRTCDRSFRGRPRPPVNKDISA